MTVLACQAGKDVYVEKPASHNVVEGRRMVEAARKYDRVVQVGTQRRSTPHVQEAIEHVRSGRIGKVGMARAWIHQKASEHRPRPAGAGARRASTTRCGKGPRPTGRSTRTASITTGTGSGTGAPASWATTASTASTSPAGASASMRPIAVSSGGGKYVFDDDQEVARHPDRHLGVPERLPRLGTPDVVRTTAPREPASASPFYGDKGTLIVDDKGWRVEDGDGAKGKRQRRRPGAARPELPRLRQEPADSPTPTSRSAT